MQATVRKSSGRNKSQPAQRRAGRSTASRRSIKAQKPPSRFNALELEEFRMALLEKRRQLVGDVNQLHEGVIDRGGAGHGSGGPAAAPSDLADRGSDEWEQSFSFGLIENKEALLRDIDAALERMADGVYGQCVATGKPVSKARLRLMPWAAHCIEYAREQEKVRR